MHNTAANDIAERVVNLWAAHEDALDDNALPYIDRLMDAIIAREPMAPEMLIDKVHTMVPRLNRGTTRRLVNLKFGNPHFTEILAA